MFEISGRDKRGDSLVEPEMVPIATCHHVAPPLMRKLVRGEPLVLLVCQNAFTIRLLQRRETVHLLFHAAGGENLRVRWSRITNAGTTFEEVEHVGRVAKNATHFGVGIVCREITQLYASVLLAYDTKRTNGDAGDVRWDLVRLAPLRYPLSVRPLALRNETTVGDGCQCGGEEQSQREPRLIGGVVNADDPVAGRENGMDLITIGKEANPELRCAVILDLESTFV